MNACARSRRTSAMTDALSRADCQVAAIAKRDPNHDQCERDQHCCCDTDLQTSDQAEFVFAVGDRERSTGDRNEEERLDQTTEHG